MLTIAGGIIVAVLFIAYLPYLIMVSVAVFAALAAVLLGGVAVTVIGGAFYYLYLNGGWPIILLLVSVALVVFSPEVRWLYQWCKSRV